MRFSYFLIAAIAVLLSGCTVKDKPIFNGVDLSGWQIYGDAKWYVEDGNLVGQSGDSESSGYLATLKDYSDFVLQLEFFPVELKNSSGVFFRTKFVGEEVSGWKAEIAETEHGTGSIFEQNGRGWLEQISEQDEEAF